MKHAITVLLAVAVVVAGYHVFIDIDVIISLASLDGIQPHTSISLATAIVSLGLLAAWVDSLSVGIAPQLKWLTRLGACGGVFAIYHHQSAGSDPVYYAAACLIVTACLLIEFCQSEPVGSSRPWLVFSSSIGIVLAVCAVIHQDHRVANASPEQTDAKDSDKEIPDASKNESVDRDGPFQDPLVDSTEVLLAVRKATLLVVNSKTNQEGSGVLIRDDGATAYALTAGHLIDRERDPVSIKFAVAPPKTILARVVDVSQDADIALLEFPSEPSFPTPLSISTNRAFGGALQAVSSGMTDGRVKLQHGTATQQTLRIPGEEEPRVFLEFDQLGVFGRSGGPLVSKSGEIVGIASGKSPDKAYFTHAVNIHNLLIRNDLGLINQSLGNE